MSNDNINQTTYNIPQDGYVSFDALSLRQLIVSRLNESGVYTDQNFIGSNLAAIIDIISYSYNTLIYYLNRTSTESMFSEAQLYENMNRIVKLIDYNPIGFQTSTLSFNCSAINLLQGLYTIPRYSYVVTRNNNVVFSFNEDITFAKTVDLDAELLTELTQQKLIYQGRYKEYPIYTAVGDDNEILILDTANELVDHFNIDVYVKSIESGNWELYSKTSNLYLENGDSKKYSIRLNSNNRYEISFGNNINGKKLERGDQVAVYYIVSNGTEGEVGPFSFDGTSIPIRFETPQYEEIITSTFNNQYRYLTNREMNGIRVENDTASTYSQLPESIEQIRETAPATYRSQYRLVTTTDYETYIKTNFANLVSDIKVINNWDYVSKYLKYFYDIGLTDPAKTERALLNQVYYSDSCNFNNIYLISVPKTGGVNTLNYLLPAQKQLINTSLLDTKMTTTETTFLDPVYKAVTFGIQTGITNTLDVDDNEARLVITKKDNSRRDNQAIINDVINIFARYFDRSFMKLGQTLEVRALTQEVLNVDGVQSFETELLTDSNIKIKGLSLLVWNPLYVENDIQIVQSNITTDIFEFYYFNNIQSIQNLITVKTTNTIYEPIEY